MKSLSFPVHALPLKRFLLSMLLLSLNLSACASEKATMLIIAKHSDNPVALVVQSHKHTEYELPGGRLESGHNLINAKVTQESSLETALRETTEETRGYLGRSQLMQQIDLMPITEGDEITYITAVPYFELHKLKRIVIPDGKKWKTMREVVDYAWLDLNLVQQGELIDAETGLPISLRQNTKQLILRALKSQRFTKQSTR